MVTTKLQVKENGDLELPVRPRRRLRVRSASRRHRTIGPSVPTRLGYSTLID